MCNLDSEARTTLLRVRPLRRPLAALALVLACVFSAAATAGYTNLYVFGDSLADSGNAFTLNTVTNPGLGALSGLLVPANPLNPYPHPGTPFGTTKYTNGDAAGNSRPIGVEVLAHDLGLALVPSTAGGTNYSVGGATTGVKNFAYEAFQIPFPPPNGPVTPFYPALQDKGLAGELVQFTASLGGSSADPRALYVVWAGPNDVFLDGAAYNPFAAAGNVAGAVSQLYALGGRTFLVPNMPDLGKTPEFSGTPGAGALTAASVAFNTILDGLLDALELTSPGLDIRPFDVFALLNDAIANPGSYGFTNVTQGCLIVGCTNPDEFLFWDGVHPTARAQAILGAGFFAAVPEPGTLVLLALAGALALLVRGRALSPEH